MDSYSDDLRKIKSLLIVTSLQEKTDLKLFETLLELKIDIDWEPLSALMIEKVAWEYVTQEKRYDPKLVFCHPEVLKSATSTSLYYRCLSGLSIKAAKDYVGSIENLEKGNKRARIDDAKALKMARVYNTFVCTILKGSTDWTLENGKRTIIATLGITLDGVMRNKVGTIAEERVRTLIFEWLKEKNLITSLAVESTEEGNDDLPNYCALSNDLIMRFSSEPDVSFSKKIDKDEELLAIIEIKGGIDPAGTLERYGAATKSFQHALKENPRCKNFFLSAVYTTELQNRIQGDRLVEKYYDIIEILEEPSIREEFFNELFHYSLRLT